MPYIEGWYVTEKLRRQGIGRALIQKAEKHAPKRSPLPSMPAAIADAVRRSRAWMHPKRNS